MSRFCHFKINDRHFAKQAWCCLLLVMCSLTSPLFAEESATHFDEHFEPFSFLFIGDPQIGYGNGYEQGSYQRFIDQAKVLNSLPADFVIMPGDFVESNTAYQWRLFMQGLKQYDKQVFLIPGNHDVQSLLDLKRYRDRLGVDYYDFVVHNCAFVMINSETARDGAIDIDEHMQQWNWLEKTLEVHARAKRRHIFLVMHRPLYRFDHEEKSAYENWPRDTRARLLKLIEKYNVSAVLAGHLHQTTQLQLHNTLANAFTVGGTSKLWDDKGHGYRRFTVDANGIHEEYQVFEPSWPAHWRFAGINGYVPAIIRGDMVTYGIIALHVLAMLLCYRTWRHWKHVNYSRPSMFWGCSTLVMLLLTLNQVLSLNELCMIFGAHIDYLPTQSKGGITMPLALIVLLTTVTLGVLVVYYRYFVIAKFGWVTLYALTIQVGMFMISMTTYEPWLGWQSTSQWTMVLAGSCLLIGVMAIASASHASQRVRPPARISRPRQIQKTQQTPQAMHASTPRPVKPVSAPAPVADKPQVTDKAPTPKPKPTPVQKMRTQGRPVQKKPVTDAFLAAQFRSGRH